VEIPALDSTNSHDAAIKTSEGGFTIALAAKEAPKTTAQPAGTAGSQPAGGEPSCAKIAGPTGPRANMWLQRNRILPIKGLGVSSPNAAQPLALSLVPQLEPERTASLFIAARLRRQLSVEEAARRSGITADQVRWIEAGRAYAFRTPDDALAAAALLASGLGLDNHEARELAGLPVLPRPLERNPRGRIGVIVALLAVMAAGAALAGYVLGGSSNRPTATAVEAAKTATALPAAWEVRVRVLNGGGDVAYTRRVASRIQALGYHVTFVGKADRFGYPRTTVFYAAGDRAIAQRLADELVVETMPLPGGGKHGQLSVVVGGRATLGTTR
jgi:transcriptional regulator with XRE-family HTH domain